MPSLLGIQHCALRPGLAIRRWSFVFRVYGLRPRRRLEGLYRCGAPALPEYGNERCQINGFAAAWETCFSNPQTPAARARKPAAIPAEARAPRPSLRACVRLSAPRAGHIHLPISLRVEWFNASNQLRSASSSLRKRFSSGGTIAMRYARSGSRRNWADMPWRTSPPFCMALFTSMMCPPPRAGNSEVRNVKPLISPLTRKRLRVGQTLLMSNGT